MLKVIYLPTRDLHPDIFREAEQLVGDQRCLNCTGVELCSQCAHNAVKQLIFEAVNDRYSS